MDTSSSINLIVSTVYYAITGILMLFSAFAIYILIRYGRNIILTLLVSSVYILFFLSILAASHFSLNALLAL
ncbi:MAG: hypothetical protein M1383_04720 [Patescibacteria group bacterium]|nr:hypothetical protein [Patescibacteria group bacterium]